IRPDQATPEAWRGLDRVRVEKVDAATADLLGAAWRSRTPLVIELQPGLGLDHPKEPPAEAITDLQPWEWSVDLDLVGERLHHALWASSVDARAGQSRYRWAAHATRLGATIDPSGEADVILPDGRRAICDGGPLDVSLAGRLGSAVVHRLGLEHGSLEPLACPRPTGLDLAPDQLAAVAEPLAGARVIAPAGSGKTRVLTERARLLQAGWKLPAAAMALVAYNVRAAEEMRTRLSDLPALRIRTLNALALRLCGGRVTVEEPDVRRILGDLVPFPRRAETDPAAPWLEALSRVRLGLAQPDAVEEEIGDVSDLDDVTRRYRATLADKGLADFDEQVTVALERLLADPVWRRRSQRFARVLLVDEFQDLTPAHMLLIRLLSGPAGAVFAVGDDDQTIYGYSGATPRWLIDFDRWFPGSADHPLQVNYRCPAPVVTAAASLLRHNSVRVPKEIRSAKATAGAALTVADGADRPASTTARRVAELLAGGAGTAEVAVLARVNASLVPVHVLLRHAGIAVNRPADSHFLQRGGVRAALAWLSVATAPPSSIPGSSLREAARRPKRAMSQSLLDLVARRRSLEGLTSLATWLESKGSGREARKVEELAADVRAVRRAAEREGATTASVLRLVRSQLAAGGLDASADALDRWAHGAIASHSDDLAALSELAELEPDPAGFEDWLREHLAGPSNESGVTLASIHSVKGREWPHVVLHHATDGLLPHRLAADVEEERRVFHVALTRCVDTVTVVTGSPPSPFVAEMSGAAPSASATKARPRAERSDGAEAGAGRHRPPPRRPSPSPRSERAQSRPAKLKTVPAAVGLRFEQQGHDYEVTSVAGGGATAAVRGGRAFIVVPFGSIVSSEGESVVLGHPACIEASEHLRAWRSERARSSGKPAYTVFDDKTLTALAAALPTSETGLAAIPGIGPVKLEAYGAELTELFDQLRSAAETATGGAT
ncbi:MAG TPA: ATP-dependent DNA helicase UvrD2, partial [Acidimicrobiales bacterium]|nr:ATP-dependent DNA helicase UvrD2 [Acidimicrobiales bacterium]